MPRRHSGLYVRRLKDGSHEVTALVFDRNGRQRPIAGSAQVDADAGIAARKVLQALAAAQAPDG